MSEETWIHFEIYVQDLFCVYYLQETHRALPKPPGKHRDDKRDQCEPGPRGKVTRARHGGRLTTGNRPHRTGKAWLIKQENRKLRVISNSFDKLEN